MKRPISFLQGTEGMTANLENEISVVTKRLLIATKLVINLQPCFLYSQNICAAALSLPAAGPGLTNHSDKRTAYWKNSKEKHKVELQHASANGGHSMRHGRIQHARVKSPGP